jgi:hypothetical protein
MVFVKQEPFDLVGVLPVPPRDEDAVKLRAIAKEVGKPVSKWPDEAGLAKVEIDRMALAFEHEDLKPALGQ